MTFKIIILFQIACILIYIISGVFFWGDSIWMLFTNLIITPIISILFLKKSEKRYFYSPVVITIPLILLLSIGLFLNDNLIIQNLTYITLIPLSSLTSHIYFKKRSFCILFIIGLSYLMSFIIFPKINSHLIYENKHLPFSLTNLDIKSRNNTLFQFEENKVYVLDFWYSSCGPCYKNFPSFETLNNKFSNDDIEFYSINVLTKNEDIHSVYKIVDSLNHNFKTLYFGNSLKDAQSNLGIESYPHIMIIKNDSIYYNGFSQNKNEIPNIISSITDKE